MAAQAKAEGTPKRQAVMMICSRWIGIIQTKKTSTRPVLKSGSVYRPSAFQVPVKVLVRSHRNQRDHVGADGVGQQAELLRHVELVADLPEGKYV
jgi:hypothetical protein